MDIRITLLAAAFLVAGCAGPAELAVPTGHTGADLDARVAAVSVDGVRIEAQPEAWRGAAIAGKVTPLRVRIENENARALRVSYDSFALLAADGTRYAALPPLAIEGTAQARRETILRPRFHHRGFHVAPHLAGMYPGLSPMHGYFRHDPLLYDRYYGYWDPVALPTQDMRALALPEGVVEPGGEVAGFLYFEAVDPAEGSVTLRVDLTDARGDGYAQARIPLSVQ